jgi:Zn-dependent peptidase ImmA (M78 family)
MHHFKTETNDKTTKNKCQRLANLKELQADTRANAFAAHLILPNRTQSPPTNRQVDIGKLENNF